MSTPPPDGSHEARHVDLVRRCLAQDAGAWDELIEDFADLVHATIVRSGVVGDDREEAFQATIVSIYEQLPRLRQPERLVGWVIGIASRQAVNQVRGRVRTRRGLEAARAKAPPAEPPLLADEELIALERAQLLREALAEISTRCRRLVQLLFLDATPRPYEEISRLEGLPHGSIGPTRQRCLDELRRRLARRGMRRE